MVTEDLLSGTVGSPSALASRWELYRVLAEPVRLRLLALAAAEELTIGELADILGESQSNVSRHVAPLKQRRLLVSVRRQGTRALVRLGERTSGRSRGQRCAGQRPRSLRGRRQLRPHRRGCSAHADAVGPRFLRPAARKRSVAAGHRRSGGGASLRPRRARAPTSRRWRRSSPIAASPSTWAPADGGLLRTCSRRSSTGSSASTGPRPSSASPASGSRRVATPTWTSTKASSPIRRCASVSAPTAARTWSSVRASCTTRPGRRTSSPSSPRWCAPAVTWWCSTTPAHDDESMRDQGRSLARFRAAGARSLRRCGRSGQAPRVPRARAADRPRCAPPLAGDGREEEFLNDDVIERTKGKTIMADGSSAYTQNEGKTYKVADITLAAWGRKEIAIAESEMPGLMALRAEFGKSQAARGRPHRRLPPHDDADRGADRDADRAGRRGRAGPRATSTRRRIRPPPPSRSPACPSSPGRARPEPEYDACIEKQLFAFKGGKGPNMILDDGGDLTIIAHKKHPELFTGSDPSAASRRRPPRACTASTRWPRPAPSRSPP